MSTPHQSAIQSQTESEPCTVVAATEVNSSPNPAYAAASNLEDLLPKFLDAVQISIGIEVGSAPKPGASISYPALIPPQLPFQTGTRADHCAPDKVRIGTWKKKKSEISLKTNGAMLYRCDQNLPYRDKSSNLPSNQLSLDEMKTLQKLTSENGFVQPWQFQLTLLNSALKQLFQWVDDQWGIQKVLWIKLIRCEVYVEFPRTPDTTSLSNEIRSALELQFGTHIKDRYKNPTEKCETVSYPVASELREIESDLQCLSERSETKLYPKGSRVRVESSVINTSMQSAYRLGVDPTGLANELTGTAYVLCTQSEMELRALEQSLDRKVPSLDYDTYLMACKRAGIARPHMNDQAKRLYQLLCQNRTWDRAGDWTDSFFRKVTDTVYGFLEPVPAHSASRGRTLKEYRLRCDWGNRPQKPRSQRDDFRDRKIAFLEQKVRELSAILQVIPDRYSNLVAPTIGAENEGANMTAANEKGVMIGKITQDSGLQMRARQDPSRIEEYTALYKDNVTLPPIRLVLDQATDTYWLVDGNHRLEAAKLAGLEVIKAHVTSGSRRDATLLAVGANATHGLHRTNEDKRRAVIVLLSDSEWSAYSDRKLAELAGVSQPLVSRLRKEMSDKVYQSGEQTPDSKPVTANGSVNSSQPNEKTSLAVDYGRMFTALLSKARTLTQSVPKGDPRLMQVRSAILDAKEELNRLLLELE